jgi:hypothetical protein
MQLGNWAHMGNIVGMDHTSTKWLRQEQGHSRSRVMRNTVLHSREQSLKPHQATRAQDRDRERLPLHRSNLHHHAIRLHRRTHNLLLCDSNQQMMVE